MSVIYSNFQCVTGLYDFASDPSAGAVGVVNLGVHIPKFSRIYGCWVTEKTNITSGGAATLSFGWLETGASAPTSGATAFMAATAIASFVLNTPLRGVDLMAAPLQLLISTDLTMSIGTAALTAGKLQVDIWYVNTDF